MGWRMHKRVRICKGLHLNVSKRGLSLSSRMGPITVNSRGIVSACIPGTGLTWREHLGSSKASGGGGAAAAAAQPTATGRDYLMLLAVSSGVIGILGVIAGLSDVSVANTDPTPTTTQPPAVVQQRITTPAAPKPPTAKPATTQLSGFTSVAPSPSLAGLFANDPFIEEGMK